MDILHRVGAKGTSPEAVYDALTRSGPPEASCGEECMVSPSVPARERRNKKPRPSLAGLGG